MLAPLLAATSATQPTSNDWQQRFRQPVPCDRNHDDLGLLGELARPDRRRGRTDLFGSSRHTVAATTRDQDRMPGARPSLPSVTARLPVPKMPIFTLISFVS